MQAAIFDMDGTLLDSMGMWSSLDRTMLLRHGIEPPADISDRVRCMTIQQAAAYYAATFLPQMTAEEIRGEVLKIAAEGYRESLQLKPGAADFLRALHGRKIPFCLVTATERPLAEAALGRLGVLPLFQFLLTPEDGFPGKHDPAVFAEAARRLGTSPQETAVFEDALYAAQTAKTAGFYTVGFYDADSRGDWIALESLCDRMAGNWFSLQTPEFLGRFKAKAAAV